MSKLRVTLNSKLTVVSSRPVTSGKVHTLSVLDRGMASHTLHVIFYYKNEDNWFKSFGLDPLRESLSKVLTLYPVVTGRLVRGENGEWEVKCNDAGVRTTKATVDATLHEWLKSASHSQEKLLVTWDDKPEEDPSTWSPFQIQINSFQEGGVAIGVSCSHMVADLTFVASFFKSWTEVHRHSPITHPPLLASLPIRGHASSSPPTKTASPKNFATATFKFSSSTIKQCLSKVHDSCPNATPFHFLAALFWTRVARVKPPKTQDQTHSLRLCTDLRSLLKPSLPIGYLGNALLFSTLSQKVKDVELGGIVSAVHRHLEEVSEEEIGASNEGKRVYGSELTCVCMEHLIVEEDQESLLYGAVFGTNEKPVHVSCRVGNVEGEGLIMVMPGSEGGLSRSVMVMLAEEEVAELSKDEAIMELEPAMLLAGCGMNH
ncbi:hypothetical protein VNO80_29632 [Phaseolus coccineus]|uniref:Uncharacterized protein n=1 Tax=Phaseolus coccineus TaxID=3886 RepID=A0AAN9LCF7_PHACN